MTPPVTRQRARAHASRSPQPSTSQRSPRRRTPPRPAPVTSPGPFEASRQRAALQQAVLPATPRTARKVQELRRQLFHEMPQLPSSSPPTSPTRCSPRRRSPSPRARSPSPRPREGPDLRETLTQLSQAMVQLVQTHNAQPGTPAPLQQQPDPRFDYKRLFSPPPQAFPTITEAQLQTIATGLHARLPQLTGRDHHEVNFILCVLSTYPQLPEPVAQTVAQRANLLHIATHLGWHNAIAATTTATTSGAVLPPGFVPQPARRPWGQQQQQRPWTDQGNQEANPAPARGRQQQRQGGRRK